MTALLRALCEFARLLYRETCPFLAGPQGFACWNTSHRAVHSPSTYPIDACLARAELTAWSPSAIPDSSEHGAPPNWRRAKHAALRADGYFRYGVTADAAWTRLRFSAPVAEAFKAGYENFARL